MTARPWSDFCVNKVPPMHTFISPLAHFRPSSTFVQSGQHPQRKRWSATVETGLSAACPR